MRFNIFSREVHREHNPEIYWILTKRHFSVFFKNKLVVFFSLLVPIVTLLVYIIFLRQLEINQINMALKEFFKDYPTVSGNAYYKAHLFADAWMLAGILSVSCISVSLNTCQMMISDRERGVTKDFMSSPISRRSVNVSYLIFNILATLLVNFFVMLLAFIYLAALGGFRIKFTNILLFIPVLILSVTSASLITCFLVSFITNGAIFNSATAVISSAVGFLIGAFMPQNMFPQVAQRVTLFFPGTYSAALFRGLFLEDYFDYYKNYLITVEGISKTKVEKIASELQSTFSFDINFFGIKLSRGYMVLAIIIFIIFFLILNYLFLDKNFTSSLHGKIKIRKKHK